MNELGSLFQDLSNSLFQVRNDLSRFLTFPGHIQEILVKSRVVVSSGWKAMRQHLALPGGDDGAVLRRGQHLDALRPPLR